MTDRPNNGIDNNDSGGSNPNDQLGGNDNLNKESDNPLMTKIHKVRKERKVVSIFKYLIWNLNSMKMENKLNHG